MGLAVDPPTPPSLEESVDASDYSDVDVSQTADYRRVELAEFLERGAWIDAWSEWTNSTTLTENEYAIVEDLGLIGEFDFFWDDFANRVGYHAPGLPEDWKTREIHSDLCSWEQVSNINASLTELGQIVSDVLKSDYIDWEAAYEVPDDIPDFEN